MAGKRLSRRRIERLTNNWSADFLRRKLGTNVLSLEELRGKKVLDLAAGNAAAGNDDARALPGKGQRSCFADTGSASSDDHRLVLECFHS